jgi:NitT/TauT family transport system substrate-binding protein
MVLSTHRNPVEQHPELVRVLLGIHKQASEYAMSHRARS